MAITKIPKRKIIVTFVTGALVGGTTSVLTLVWPDHPFAPFLEDFRGWVEVGVALTAGLIVKEGK